MGLTPRQRQFLEALAELCRTSGRSVHYSAVAEALSVSPFSAYDMLKVLESKGVVSSEYVVEGGSPSPGRSAIRFWPMAGLGLAPRRRIPVGGRCDSGCCSAWPGCEMPTCRMYRPRCWTAFPSSPHR